MKKMITAVTPAMFYGHHTPDSLMNNPPAKTMEMMILGDRDVDGWVKMGSATVVIEFDDEDQVVLNMIESLKAKKRNVQASAEREINEIELEIQSLQAIEYKP